MRGITLTQPWATLVAVGAKVIETRPARQSYRGPLAIHAALGYEGFYGHRADALIGVACSREPFRSVLLDAGFRQDPSGPMAADQDGELVASANLPRGKIVALAELVEVVPTTEARSRIRRGLDGREHEAAFGDYTVGRFAWRLEDVRPLSEPLEFRGNQTLFQVPDEVAREVESRAATPDRKERHPWL